MRGAMALSLTAVACLMAVAPASAATLKGIVKIRAASCTGVRLIARNAESEREVAAMFGGLGPSVVDYPADPRVAATPRLGRNSYCSGWSAGYRFNKVAPGDYFVTVAARRRGAYDREELVFGQSVAARPRGTPLMTYMMRPVTVRSASGTIALDFRQD